MNGERTPDVPGKVVPRDDVKLEEPKDVLSPPYLVEPVYACAKLVVVRGFVPHAELEVSVDGSPVTTVADAGMGVPGGAVVALPTELQVGEVVTALQRFGGAESGSSPSVTVSDYRLDYPAGVPQPKVDPPPLHECGVATAISNVLTGSEVWVTADGNEVARLDAGGTWIATYVNPAFSVGQEVRAFASLCGDESPPSASVTTQPRPSSLPTPVIDPVIDGAELIVVRSLVNGARFHVWRDGNDEGEWATAGPAASAALSSPMTVGQVITVSQRLCPGDPESPPGTTTVLPCSALGAPVVVQPQAGDTTVQLVGFVPGARFKVFLNGVKVGDGSGPIVLLTEPVGLGDVVHVLQELGHCVSASVRELEGVCVAPPIGDDPAGLHLFPVGNAEYDGGSFDLDGTNYPIRGTVYYPAESDGERTPFDEALAKGGAVPIVFMAHGNHYTFHHPNDRNQESCSAGDGWIEIPNHEGYDYFQRQLAGMGIVAVSVYSNPTNCIGYSQTNMRHRAELILASIAHFRDLTTGGDALFGDRIDLGRVGLMGHSRGGEAVVIAPEVASVPGLQIRAVLSLAPTDAGASSGQPRGYALLVILPAADGDVASNDGAHYYDAADPAGFKSQLYVDGANHNYFNRQWPADDPGVGPNRLTRGQQERILSAYGCALFRATLLGHDTSGFLTGLTVPPNVPAARIHTSAVLEGQTTVDDHEQDNGIGRNSMDEPTDQQNGLSADEYPFRQGGGAFNGTFYGNTVGMVVESRTAGEFRSQLDGPRDVRDREVWIRAGEVMEGAGSSTGFELGLEDGNGTVVWVDSDYVGGVPRPYPRGDGLDKTIPSTLRFRSACFAREKLELDGIVAIRLRLNREEPRPLAFDDLQIVEVR
jgi:hypothetical protein